MVAGRRGLRQGTESLFAAGLEPGEWAGRDLRTQFLRMALGLVAVMGCWAVVAVVIDLRAPGTHDIFLAMTRALAGGLLLAASALRLATWRILHTARTAWSSVALAVAGFAFPMVSMVGLAAGGADPTPIARALVEFSLIGFALAAVRADSTPSQVRPIRTSAPFLLGCVGICVVVIIRGPLMTPGPTLHQTILLTQAICAAMWTVVGVVYLLRGRARGSRTLVLIGAALSVLAIVSTVRAVLGDLPYDRMMPPAAGQLAAALMIASGAAIRLWQLQTGRSHRLQRITGDRDQLKEGLSQAEQDQARRLHDARSSVLAISGAAHLIGGDDQDSRLQALLSGELERLTNLLDPGARSSVREFGLRSVLEPLVLMHQLGGGIVEDELADVTVLGRPDALAAAMRNVLANAGVHAPGAQVWVSVQIDPKTVRVIISDDGRGIPVDERQLVLEPGFRGRATADGSGLGLPAAARAMAEQGGTLLIGDRPGGGLRITLVLRRPVARTADDEHPARRPTDLGSEVALPA